jgi:protocatechuate 3,4-dioxygenase beta subunit
MVSNTAMTNHSDQSDALEDHDFGLAHDLPKLVERGEAARLGRRGLFGLVGGVGLSAALMSCAEDDVEASRKRAGSTSVAAGEIPEETAGPFPGDGSNGPNILTETGVVRSDITSSFGTASGVADGLPLTVKLKVYDLNGSDATPLAGAAVYIWHCDRDGNYSMYSDAAADENYLRGVQEADADGNLEFTTIYPGAYSGRWPHIHFEVYESLDAATSATTKLRTSQLAFPQDVCEEVYAGAQGYEASIANLAATSLDSDMVFSDGYSLQMAKLTGSLTDGYVATLNVPV